MDSIGQSFLKSEGGMWKSEKEKTFLILAIFQFPHSAFPFPISIVWRLTSVLFI
jgi:hypothetical protein